jgi:protoporphyrinogen oxidase
MMQRTAIIIGAGPAGLTAALELLERSDIIPIVLQRDEFVGGISRTVLYKGNRMDLGGHRFFSKSDRVMNWWLRILPLEPGVTASKIGYQSQSRTIFPTASTDVHPDKVMLLRPRKSRIYFLRKFFDYPISMSRDTLVKLGVIRTIRIIASYARSVVFPIRSETNLEHFFINRFGRELYRTFFKAYTEKVWGTDCNQINADWGRQRIKGLDVWKLVTHYLGRLLPRSSATARADKTETSLIEQFLYPKLGPGQMWEEVARQIIEKGGQVIHNQTVDQIHISGDEIVSLSTFDSKTQTRHTYQGEFYFSTMAVRDLVNSTHPAPSESVCEVSRGLLYRDFITVGLLLEKLKINAGNTKGAKLLEDNWIYIQEPDVYLGRLQIFNNWSPALVADPSKVWLGLEYFCYESDPIWGLTDEQMMELATKELSKIGIIDVGDVLDGTVVREPKTYPAYFGTYDRFPEVQAWLDGIVNLFPIGRNGMHRYNNQDHSMLTAMTAVDNILEGRLDKSNLWAVNTEQVHHERKD